MTKRDFKDHVSLRHCVDCQTTQKAPLMPKNVSNNTYCASCGSMETYCIGYIAYNSKGEWLRTAYYSEEKQKKKHGFVPFDGTKTTNWN